MVVNASARKVQLLIGGKDFSSCFTNFSGSDNHLDQSGLISFTGSITLVKAPEFDESLDDRRNLQRFHRGQAVLINVSDSSGFFRRHPRGCLRILSANYNDETKIQTLEVGDLSRLINFQEPIDSTEDIKIELGGNTTASQIIIKLLNKAGIFSISGVMPNARMNYPINFSGSYLGNVGKLLYANNLFGWIDSNETFRLEPANIVGGSTSLTMRIGKDEIWYRRIDGAEIPCQSIKAVGRLTTVRPTVFLNEEAEQYASAATISGEYSEFTTVIVRKTKIRESWDKQQNILTTETWTEEPIGVFIPEKLIGSAPKLQLLISERRIERRRFEQNEEGKLLKIEVESYQPQALAIAEFLEANPNVIVNAYARILMEETNTNYIYDKKDRLERIKSIINQTDGLILTGTDEDWKRWIFSPTNLVNFEIREDGWAEENKDIWTYEFSVRSPLVKVKPERVIVEPGSSRGTRGPRSNKLNLIYSNGERKTSNSGQLAPPAPERRPAEFQMEEEDIEEKVQFAIPNSNFRPRQRTFSVEFLAGEFRPGLRKGEVEIGRSASSFAKNQLQEIARREGNLLIGRSKGQEIASALVDEWFSYHPLMGITVIEPDGTVIGFLADGTSWVLSATRAFVSTDGIWVGSYGINNQVVPPFPEIGQIEQGAGLGAEFRGFAWGLNAGSGDAQGGIGIASQWIGAFIEDEEEEMNFKIITDTYYEAVDKDKLFVISDGGFITPTIILPPEPEEGTQIFICMKTVFSTDCLISLNGKYLSGTEENPDPYVALAISDFDQAIGGLLIYYNSAWNFAYGWSSFKPLTQSEYEDRLLA